VIHAEGLSYASGFPTTKDARETACKACATLGSDGFIARINPAAATGPEALEYSSFIGGQGPSFAGDYVAGVAMDSTGAVYVTGYTTSQDFPVTPGAFQTTCPGCVGYSLSGLPYPGFASFVAKLDPSAAPDNQLVYATYLDGSSSGPGSSNAASGIALDSMGEAYAVGVSFTSDFPTTANAYSNSCAHGACVYLAKLDSTGSNLLYSSFIGEAGFLYTSIIGVGSTPKVAIDPQNNALISGTTAGNFPTTAGALQSVCGACSSGGAGFFSQINPSASGAASLLYSTYLSGSGGIIGATPMGDAMSAIAADPNGNAVLTGIVTSKDFPTTPNAYQTECQPFCESPTITVINPALSGQSALIYSTYFNGNGGGITDPIAFPYAVTVDANHNIYVGGRTFAVDFPVSANGFIPQCPSPPGFACELGTGFIAELNPSALPANQLVYGTYLGGTSDIGYEAVTGLGVDLNGRIYAAGQTLSADFPVTPDAVQPTCLACSGALQDSNNDGFLTVLNPALSGANELVYSTFLGGNNYDAATGLAMGPTGLVAVAGYSSSLDFPTTANALELQCPACRNIGERGNGPVDGGPGLINSDAFLSVFQF
jgi:hypothetical protein